MKKLNKTDIILSISHKDLDGCVCQVILANYFINITYVSTNYSDIDQLLNTIKYNQYDAIFLTDISPSSAYIFEITDKIILIDHHDTAIQYHDPKKNRYVISGYSGSWLVKKYMESVYKINLDHLTNLVYLANDYDMWVHHNKKSRMINELFFYYWETGFRNRFLTGDTRFTNIELKLLRDRCNHFKDVVNNIEVNKLDKIPGCVVISKEFVNDICEKLLNEGYSIVFCINPKNNRTSIRHRIENLHIGKFCENLKIGGGHKDAAGLTSTKLDEIKSNISKIEDLLVKFF